MIAMRAGDAPQCCEFGPETPGLDMRMMNGGCSDVYECSKNAVGLQKTAKNCKQTGPPYRISNGRRTPYVVL
jgi:hypothetical protein